VSLYRSSALGHAGTTRLVALPSNHEMMSGKNQPAFANAEAVWLGALALCTGTPLLSQLAQVLVLSISLPDVK
jgi:hypothetical protein